MEYILRYDEYKLKYFNNTEDLHDELYNLGQKAVEDFEDEYDLEIGENISAEKAVLGAELDYSIHLYSDVIEGVNNSSDLEEEEKEDILLRLKKKQVANLLDDYGDLQDVLDEIHDLKYELD